MKHLVLLFVAVMMVSSAWAQKFVFVDTEYVLSNIPAFEAANEQLDQVSKQYETELKAKFQEVEKLYEAYRTESVFLSTEMKVKKENEIVEKEQAVKKLQQTYFGQNGDLQKRRETLIKPIQDQVFNTVSAYSQEKGYSAVFDKSSSYGLIYSESSLDISDAILARMGYKK